MSMNTGIYFALDSTRWMDNTKLSHGVLPHGSIILAECAAN